MEEAQYLFDGGVIADPNQIRLQEEELEAFEFLPTEQAVVLSVEVNRPQIQLALEARQTGKTKYQPTCRQL